MRGLNKVMLLGRLGRDPELRTSTNGTVVFCSFSLATNRNKKAGDQWVEETDWHRVKVFGTQAELCHRYLSKGQLVHVEGSISYDTWERDGVKRTSTVILGDRVTFVGGRPAAQEPVAAQEVAQAK